MSSVPSSERTRLLARSGNVNEEEDPMPDIEETLDTVGRIPSVKPPPIPVAAWDKSIYVVYGMAIMSNFVLQLVTPIIVLCTNARGWTELDNIRYYTTIYFVGVAVPIVTNPTFTKWSVLRSSKEVIIGVSFLTMVGFFCMMAEDRLAFAVGYAITQGQVSLRTVRHAYIARVADSRIRTNAMAGHSVVTPFGSMVGPLMLLLITNLWPSPDYQAQFQIINLKWAIHIDRWNVIFLVAAFSMLLKMVAVALFFREVPLRTGGTETRVGPWVGEVEWVDSAGNQRTMSTKKWIRQNFILFAVVLMLVNFASGFFTVALQPIMVNRFEYNQHMMARFFIVVTGLSVIPAVSILFLTRIWTDLQVMIFGLSLKLIGMLLFSIPPIDQYRVMIGFVLLQKATLFFFTCSITLFSKMLQLRAQGLPFGLLVSLVAVANALASVIGGESLAGLFNTWWFPVFTSPVIFALLVVLCPPVYRYLDPTSNLVRQMNCRRRYDVLG